MSETMSMRFAYTIMSSVEEEEVDSGETPTPLTLSLQPSDEAENGVDLVVLDSDGDIELYVLTLNEDGTFFRHEDGNFAGEHSEANPNNLLVLDE